jgi:hypothetical protein
MVRDGQDGRKELLLAPGHEPFVRLLEDHFVRNAPGAGGFWADLVLPYDRPGSRRREEILHIVIVRIASGDEECAVSPGRKDSEQRLEITQRIFPLEQRYSADVRMTDEHARQAP